MAHELDFSNGSANMAYVGTTPWHGLGQRLTDGAPLDQWIVEAGFDWEVKKAPVIYQAGGQDLIVPKRWVLHRSDTNAPLSVMSSNYNITQPREVAEFFRDLVEAGGFKMETMGMLRGGATYWALARVDDSYDVGFGDDVLPYLLLATSCDGTLSNCAMFTTVRVVCQNTLSLSVGQDGRNSQIRVPHSTAFNADKFKAELGLIGGSWDRFKKDAKDMSKVKLSREEALRFFMDVLYPKADHEEFDPETKRPLLRLVTDIYESGVGQGTKSAKHTLWGAVNAITRMADHERQAASNDSRLQSAWFGAGARQKTNAWATALELLAA